MFICGTKGKGHVHAMVKETQMSEKTRVVIALGGNALGNNAQEQIELVRPSFLEGAG